VAKKTVLFAGEGTYQKHADVHHSQHGVRGACSEKDKVFAWGKEKRWTALIRGKSRGAVLC